MKLIKADFERRLALPGVPGLVQRPVDIDRSQTSFANLRSLRIYRFHAGSTIDGHAEEDEVFVVVLTGSIDFTASGDTSGESRTFTLSAVESGSPASACVAYLPPQAAYKLFANSDAEVAYARATPASGNRAQAFSPRGWTDAAGVTVLLEEKTYAQRLALRLLQVNATQGDLDFESVLDLGPTGNAGSPGEALIHVRTTPAEKVVTVTDGEGGPIRMDSWDTLAVAPRDRPTIHVASQSSALVLVVLAT